MKDINDVNLLDPKKCTHPRPALQYIDDRDNGDWVEAIYECSYCGRIVYEELPD